jgi:nucleoid-associated protein YgaU
MMALPDTINSIKNLYTELKLDDVVMMDFWTSWQLSRDIIKDADSFTTVIMGEGNTWHDVSEVAYGKRELWWVIALYNGVTDPFSLFFERSVNDSITRVQVPDEGVVNIILNAIREDRVRREKNG